MIRCLVFYAAYFHFADHVPGVLNTAADAISCDRISLFTSLVPQVAQVSIPQAVLDLLILGLTDLDKVVHELFSKGIAESTRAVYRSGWHRYTRFCTSINHSPLPLTEYTLCHFAASLVSKLGHREVIPQCSQISPNYCRA